MIGNPVVSIVIPTYNREKLLPVAVESVLRQTFADWELLIIDDRSTDNTRQLVVDYARRDPRIKYHVNGRTKGPSGARNQGIDLAADDFVAFLDSDDEWEPFHLEVMVSYLRRYSDKIDVMTANPIRRRSDTGEVYDQRPLDLSTYRYERVGDAYVFDTDWAAEGVISANPPGKLITTQTMVMKREVTARVRFDEEIPAGPEDVVFHNDLAYNRVRIAHLQEAHVTYWAHGDNLTCCAGLTNPSQRLDYYLALEHCIERAAKKFRLRPEAVRARRYRLADILFWQVGYNGYLQLGDYARARQYFRKAMAMAPTRATYWRVYLGSFVKQVLHGLEPQLLEGVGRD